jgi:hypothetical protein
MMYSKLFAVIQQLLNRLTSPIMIKKKRLHYGVSTVASIEPDPLTNPSPTVVEEVKPLRRLHVQSLLEWQKSRTGTGPLSPPTMHQSYSVQPSPLQL